MTRRSPARPLLIGAAAALAFGALLPAALVSTARREDLSLLVAGEKPHRVSETVMAGGSAPRLLPEQLLPRVQAPRAALGPGLDLSTWRVVYGNRWEREVTLPSLLGPIDREGSPGACGFALRIGAGLLDTRGAGAPLRAEADRLARTIFPRHLRVGVVDIDFPAISGTELLLEPRAGRLGAKLSVTLEDGTTIDAQTELRIEARGGQLRLTRRGPVATRWAGKTRDDLESSPLVIGASMLDRIFGGGNLVGRMVEEELTRQADVLLSALSLGLGALGEPWAPFADRPGDKISLRLPASPSVDPEGVTVLLCPSVTLDEPRQDAQIHGAPLLAAAAPRPSASEGPADRVELSANAQGVQTLLYVLWQTGKLADWGRSEAVLGALPASLGDLDFESVGFEPRLPPVVAPGAPERPSDGLPIAVGDVAMGRAGARTVIGHGTLDLRIVGRAEGLRLEATLREPRINCAAREGGSVRLSPCLSDLLPLIRDELAARKMTLPPRGGELLAALAGRSFGGFQIAMQDLSVTTDGVRAELHARVRARLLPRR